MTNRKISCFIASIFAFFLCSGIAQGEIIVPFGYEVDVFANVESPMTLDFDSSGNLFAGISSASSIKKISPDGTVSIFGDINISDPDAIVVDCYDYVFVGGGNGVLYRLSPEGRTSTVAGGLGNVTVMTIDRLGDYGNKGDFIAGRARNTPDIFKIGRDGFSSPFVSDQAIFIPRGMAFDKDGNLYLAEIGAEIASDQNDGGIFLVAPDGSVTDFVTPGSLRPTSMVFNEVTNKLYVGERDSESILEISLDGTVTTLATGIQYAYGLAFSPSGDLYISELFNDRIIRISGFIPASLVDCDPNAEWDNHGHYVRCVAHQIEELVSQGVIDQEEGDEFIKAAAKSDIGKKH